MTKLHPRLLAKYMFRRIGVRDENVIIGPSYGEDSAIIDLGNGRVLVVHSDPITGAVERIGWLSVHISSNDVAVRGARPRWLLPVIFLPEDASEATIDAITKQMDLAAREVGAMIVGGHSEYTPRINRPLISMTAMGVAEKSGFIRTSNAKVGDSVLMTKGAGIEGTFILASDFKSLLLKKGVEGRIIDDAEKLINEISVVKEALALAEIGVNSMHDPTEGGLICGLAEMAYASNVQISVYEEKMLVRKETRVICGKLGLDPLKLISSGCLLATVPKERLSDALEKLSEVKVKFSVIGEVGEGRGLTVKRVDGTVEDYGEYVEDELFKLWVDQVNPQRKDSKSL